MDVQALTYLFVIGSFALYIGIAVWSRAASTGEFYVAEGGVHPVANGMATAADWMSAASFISMAGIIAFMGYDGAVYLMGWTGGYVLLALLLAPYLRKFGEFTVPDFIGARYYSNAARVVAVVCLIVVSFTYVAGQMRGVGIVFSHFLNVDIIWGVVIGMAVVFFYAVLGGMKGITYTQVAQYCVLIFAYLVPAIFISLLITDIPIPQIGLGAAVNDGSGLMVLEKLDRTLVDLGFGAYTDGSKAMIDVFAITLALMIGTAGLPHVIVRFFTVPKVSDARRSAGYALLFIALLYTTAPAVGAFARLNFIDTVQDAPYAEVDDWFKRWEDIGSGRLAGQERRRGHSVRARRSLRRPAGLHRRARRTGPADAGQPPQRERQRGLRGPRHHGAGQPGNRRPAGLGDRAGRGGRLGGGALHRRRAAAGDLHLGLPRPDEEDPGPRHQRPAGTALRPHRRRHRHRHRGLPGHQSAGLRRPGGGLRLRPGRGIAVSGHPARHLLRARHQGRSHRRHVSGLIFTFAYIAYFKFVEPGRNNADHWWFGISPEGIGALGAALNFATALIVSRLTPAVPAPVKALIASIRVPAGVERPHDHP